MTKWIVLAVLVLNSHSAMAGRRIKLGLTKVAVNLTVLVTNQSTKSQTVTLKGTGVGAVVVQGPAVPFGQPSHAGVRCSEPVQCMSGPAAFRNCESTVTVGPNDIAEIPMIRMITCHTSNDDWRAAAPYPANTLGSVEISVAENDGFLTGVLSVFLAGGGVNSWSPVGGTYNIPVNGGRPF